jgi:hypothetical protein
MARNKSSISKASTYEEIGAFWDTHDLADYWDQTKPVEFEVELKSETTFFAIESGLSSRIRELAIQRGVSPETLLNLWVQEKLQEEAA